MRLPQPVKLLVISTALPLQSGSPRQRAAHALREVLAAQAAVTHLTVDAWSDEWGGSEWAARGRMLAGDRLLPAAFGQAALHQGQNPDQRSTWINPRRRQRIVALATAASADLVLLTDPLLADLALDLHPLGRPVLLWDEGMADWAGVTAAMVRDAVTSQSLRQTGAVLGQDRDRWAPLLRSVLRGAGLAIEVPPDPLFFHKANNLVVPATGIPGCDRIVLDLVAQFYAHIYQRDPSLAEPPHLILIGFAPDLVARLRRCLPTDQPMPGVQAHWDKLHTAVGAARCLFIPFAPPALAALAQGALAVGTPVLTLGVQAALLGGGAQAAVQGWQRTTGIFADQSAGLPLVLAQLLDPALMAEAQYRQIAAATATRPQPAGLTQLLAQIGPQPVSPVAAPAAHPVGYRPPFHPRRIPPVAGRARVLYTPATGMLLLRLTLRTSAQIDEVRLLDASGAELNRLAPPLSDGVVPGPLIAMEGGVVIGRDALDATLGAALRIELHDGFGKVADLAVPVAEFDLVEAEIAMARIEDMMLRGAFWVADTPAARAWAIGFGAGQSAGQSAGHSLVTPRGAVPMPEVGALAVPFAVPLPLATDQVDCMIWANTTLASSGQHNTDQHFAPLVQRPYDGAAQGLGTGSGRRHAVRAGSRAAIRALKDKHGGQRAWIIGNGPSVRLDDLARVPAGDVIFCFNRFYLSYADGPLREDYVVSADTLMIRDFGAEMIERSTGLPLFCLPAERITHLTEDVATDYTGRFIHLPPSDFYLPVFSLDPGDFVTVGGSSVFVALQMAHYMGIRDVVLYGMDYSFSVKMQRDPRFAFPVSFEEGNHFIKSYRGAKPWCPPTWRDISAGFLNARVAFDLAGGRIVNATRGGRLETFARADFETLV